MSFMQPSTLRSAVLAKISSCERRLRNVAGGRPSRRSSRSTSSVRGGAEPDLLDEVVWWQTDDFWQYALYAAVAYIRAAAGRAGVPVRQVCQELAQLDGPRPR